MKLGMKRFWNWSSAARIGVSSVELYTDTSRQLSRMLTLRYSSSFGMSSRLFGAEIRDDVFSVYGLVRIADEIVDSYQGDDATKRRLLDDLEAETYAAIERRYSPNPIVHAYADVAARYKFDRAIIEPFFASMRMDIEPHTYTDALYETYIHGSAEVVGLMCLKIFCGQDPALYARLEPGARALGSAYQKVNFLRDVAADHAVLGRMYFPGVDYETFSDAQKDVIVTSIEAEFVAAKQAIEQLPASSRRAVLTSYVYYTELLQVLKQCSVDDLKAGRQRVSDVRKWWLLVRTTIIGRATYGN